MKKKLFALIAVLCVLMMILVACGGGGNSAPAAAADGGEAVTEATVTEAPAGSAEETAEAAADSAEETAEAAVTEAPADSAEADTEAAAVEAETYDVGDFTLSLPAGWIAFPQNDIFGDQDEEGNYPIDPASIYVSKDAKEEWDLFSAPYVYITYQKPSVTHLSSRDSFYENTEDLDVTIDGGTIEEAYEGDSTIIENWRYQIIHFATDNAQFDVTIPTIIEGEEIGYSIADSEVMTIINSLTGK